MAIYRTVSMSFWTDSKVVDEFTPEDKYFYLYLFTNPHTNLCGCYELSIKQVELETGYSKDAIYNLIKRFESVHDVVRYSKKTKEILLINWSKYNWTTSDKFRKPLAKELENIKDKNFREYLVSVFNGENKRYPIYTNCIDTSDTDTDTDTNANKNIQFASLEYEFEDVWKMYPRKQGKEKAKTAYIRARQKGTKEDDVRNGIKAYIDHIERNKIEPQYIKMGSTFFANKSWQDDYSANYTRGRPDTRGAEREYDMRELELKLLATN